MRIEDYFDHPTKATHSFRVFVIQNIALNPHRRFGRDGKGVNQSRRLTPAVLDGLAGLDTQHHRQFVPSLLETPDAVVQEFLPFIGRHIAHRFCCPDNRDDRIVDDFGICNRHAGCDLSGIFVHNLEVGVRL